MGFYIKQYKHSCENSKITASYETCRGQKEAIRIGKEIIALSSIQV